MFAGKAGVNPSEAPFQVLDYNLDFFFLHKHPSLMQPLVNNERKKALIISIKINVLPLRLMPTVSIFCNF